MLHIILACLSESFHQSLKICGWPLQTKPHPGKPVLAISGHISRLSLSLTATGTRSTTSKCREWSWNWHSCLQHLLCRASDRDPVVWLYTHASSQYRHWQIYHIWQLAQRLISMVQSNALWLGVQHSMYIFVTFPLPSFRHTSQICCDNKE